MTRTPHDRVVDILDAIARCRRYRESFADASPLIAEMALDAALRNIGIIGEAVGHLPAEISGAHPDIPWSAIVGMRNTVIHQYFRTDPAIVIEVIDRDLIPLAAALAEHRPARDRGQP